MGEVVGRRGGDGRGIDFEGGSKGGSKGGSNEVGVGDEVLMTLRCWDGWHCDTAKGSGIGARPEQE